jgi:cellulose biosynthesis protein BcsQ
MIAGTLADAGRAVHVVDLDPQRTATKWITETSPPGITLDNPAPDSIVVIDTPPRLDAPGVLDAIKGSDIVMIVSTPSPVDAWTARETAQEVKRVIGKAGKVRIVFNMVQAHTLLSQDLDATAKLIGASAVKTTITRRTCYAHAALYGMKALTATARQELLRLALEIVA